MSDVANTPSNDASPTEKLASFDELLAAAHAAEDQGAADTGSDTATIEDAVAEGNHLPEGQTPDEMLAEGEEDSQEEVEAETPEEAEARKAKPLEETPAFNQLGKRAQARIGELVKTTKEFEARMASLDAGRAQDRAQMRAYVAQLEQAALAREEALRAELEQYRTERTKARELEEARENEARFAKDPVAKFKHEVLTEAEQRAAARTAEIERRFREKEEAEAAARAQAEAQRKTQENYARWNSQLQRVLPEVIFAGVEDKGAISKLSAPLQNMLLAYAAAGAEEPEKAAAEFIKVMDEAAALRAKAKAKAAGARVAPNKKLPAGSLAGKSGSSTPANPSDRPPPAKHVLGAMGFSNSWEWRRAGSPPPRPEHLK